MILSAVLTCFIIIPGRHDNMNTVVNVRAINAMTSTTFIDAKSVLWLNDESFFSRLTIDQILYKIKKECK